MAQTAEVQYALQKLRNGVLAQALAEHIATAAANNVAADKLAQTIYKAEPERFAVPVQTRARHIFDKAQAQARSPKQTAGRTQGQCQL